MQFSLRKIFQLTSWISICTCLMLAVEGVTERFALSQILCGVTLFQLPFGQAAEEQTKDDLFEHWLCLIVVGLVGSFLVGAGVAMMTDRLAQAYGQESIEQQTTTLGVLSGVIAATFFVVFQVMINPKILLSKQHHSYHTRS